MNAPCKICFQCYNFACKTRTDPNCVECICGHLLNVHPVVVASTAACIPEINTPVKLQLDPQEEMLYQVVVTSADGLVYAARTGDHLFDSPLKYYQGGDGAGGKNYHVFRVEGTVKNEESFLMGTYSLVIELLYEQSCLAAGNNEQTCNFWSLCNKNGEILPRPMLKKHAPVYCIDGKFSFYCKFDNAPLTSKINKYILRIGVENQPNVIVGDSKSFEVQSKLHTEYVFL